MFYRCWDWFENYCVFFLFAFRSTCKGLSATFAVESLKRQSSFCIIACVRDCVHDTRLCVGLDHSDEQASISPSWARPDSDNGRNQTAVLSSQQIQFLWLRWSCRDWWHQTCPPFQPRKRHVTASWLQLRHVGAQYSVLSPVTTFRVRIGLFAHPSVSNQRTSEFSLTESKCADTGSYNTGILQRIVRNVEPVCFAASHKAFFHMNFNREGLAMNTKFCIFTSASLIPWWSLQRKVRQFWVSSQQENMRKYGAS